MPFPLLAALPYIGYGLMGAASLFSAGTTLWSLKQQREMYSREEDYSKQQSADYDRWVSDYERNTGLKVQYPYMGISGQGKYLNQVRLPSFSNLYSMNSANMWGAGARGAFGAGMSGAFGYNKWRNSGYRPSPSRDISNDPSVM